MAIINGVQVRRALVDTGTSLNLIALSTLEDVGLVDKRILGAPMEITGFKKGSHRVSHEHSSRFRNGIFHSRVTC